MKLLRKLMYKFWQKVANPLMTQLPYNNQRSEGVSQLLLQMTYKSMLHSDMPLPSLKEVGFKSYSQTDEDGILLYIFSIIGTTNKKCVEICAGNGIECNTANLIINHGWNALLIDGDPALVEQGQTFYHMHKDTYVYPPKFVSAWITRDNINAILLEHSFQGEIDLLSIDVDGVDYWFWDAIDVTNPRVVVVEYQDILGSEKALTVPYKEDFSAYNYSTTGGLPNFCGASLPAFVKLANKKGYRLVGCNRYGYNAFFIKNDLAEKEIPEIPISECFQHPKVLWGIKQRFPQTKDLPWVEV